MQYVMGLLALLAVPAVGAAPAPANVVSHATQYMGVDLGLCLRVVRREAKRSERHCPAFIAEAAAGATATCAEAGGRLTAISPPTLWSLDVNGDGKREFLFDYSENFQCDGAPSVFSCGSLGCAVSLYQRSGSAWKLIGAMGAEDAPGAEVLAPEAGASYGTLRGGCFGERGCEELSYYHWSGKSYDSTTMEIRGHWVDTASAPHGLWTLLRDEPVLATPESGAQVLDRYPAGQDVADLLQQFRGGVVIQAASDVELATAAIQPQVPGDCAELLLAFEAEIAAAPASRDRGPRAALIIEIPQLNIFDSVVAIGIPRGRDQLVGRDTKLGRGALIFRAWIPEEGPQGKQWNAPHDDAQEAAQTCVGGRESH